MSSGRTLSRSALSSRLATPSPHHSAQPSALRPEALTKASSTHWADPSTDSPLTLANPVPLNAGRQSAEDIVPSQEVPPIRTLAITGCLLALLTASTAAAARIPEKLAREARHLALHGGVTGSCHGCATSKMQALARRLVTTRFADAGSGAVSTALCIVASESGFNPGAISSTGDYGLPQMNYSAHHRAFPFWWERARGFRYLIFDPVYAVGAMWAMSARGRDWSAWTGTYGRGMCR